jgi:hypothetical protein
MFNRIDVRKIECCPNSATNAKTHLIPGAAVQQRFGSGALIHGEDRYRPGAVASAA